MRIGVVREIKPDERRVALTPAGAATLARLGHSVHVEKGAGIGAGFPDDAYARAGAVLDDDPADTWAGAELLLKVKEPVAAEYASLHRDLTLFTYLHLAPNPELTNALVESGAIAVAYETVAAADGTLPLLRPMSEVAGRLAAQAGAHHLQHPHGGPGLLIGGVPGVAPAKVVVLGGGVVGTHAARIAIGLLGSVTILDRSLTRIAQLEAELGSTATVLVSDEETVRKEVASADLVIGAVLIQGARAPKLVTREMLSSMQPGRVLVDVAIDQGGCFETSRPTTHADPTYEVDGILHYCVSNMPGAVPFTSTLALTNATFPYVSQIAELGLDGAIDRTPGLSGGVSVVRGNVTHPAVAETLGLPFVPPHEALRLADDGVAAAAAP
jgi:alanine dehydrogenase